MSRYISQEEFKERYQHFAIDSGDIVIASSGNTYGKIGRIAERHLPLMMNTSVIRFRSLDTNVLDDEYLYSFLRSPLFMRQVEAFVIGSAQPNFGPTHVKEMKILLPPLPTQRRIAGILSAYDDLIENNTRRIAILEEMAQALYREWFVHFRFPGHEAVPLVDRPDGQGQMPEGWELKTFSDVCDRITSGGTPRTKEPSYWDGDIPWLSSGETRNKIIISTEKTITKLGVENSSTRLAPSGTIVIASAGQGHTRGQTSLLMIDTYVNQSVLNLSSQSLSNLYLFFDISGRYEELRMASDSFSSRGSLTTKLMGGLSVLVPPTELVSAFENVVKNHVSLTANLLRKNANLRQTRDLLLPRLISGEVEVGGVGRLRDWESSSTMSHLLSIA